MTISTQKLVLFLLVLAFANVANAQVKIGENPTTINKGSIFELESRDKGLLFPRIALSNTTTWSLATGSLPVAGMVVYNTKKVADGFAGTVAYPIISVDGTGLYYWDGTGWVATKAVSASNDWKLLGNAGTIATANFLGTTDNVPLNFRVNNVAAGYIGATLYVNNAQDQNTTLGNNAGGNVNAKILSSNDFRKNTAIGFDAMGSGVSGAGSHTLENTAIGFNAARFIGGNSNRNVIIGGAAASGIADMVNNVVVGQAAVFTAGTLGTDNVIIGKNAGGAPAAVGAYNTFLGSNSGFNTAGSGNVLLGYQAGFSHAGNNRLMIANSNTNAPLIDGDFAGKVLTVNNTLKVADLATSAPATTGNRPVVAGADGQLMIGTAATTLTSPWNLESTTTAATLNSQNIYQNGNVGIGNFATTNPIAKLDVRGAVRGGTPNLTALVGTNSVAFGFDNTASGINSFAIGTSSAATGINSFAVGTRNLVAAQAGAVFGSDNAIRTGSGNFQVATDAIFQIGNGDNAATQSNALTVLKNGNTGIGITGVEAAAKPTERLDIGSGKVKIRDLYTTAATAADDKIVVTAADGILKTVAAGTLANEPWRIQSTTTQAINNTDNIYQQGKVAIGTTSADAITTKQLEVKGDFKSEVVNGTDVFGTEVAHPSNPTGAMHYSINGATGDYRTASANATAAVLETQAGTTKNTISAGDLQSAMSSKNGANWYSTIRTTNTGNFFTETYNVPLNYGSTISLQNDGLRLVHTTTGGGGNPFPYNNRTELIVQKENGIGIDLRDGTTAVKANYWFPTTTGTAGQVMTQTITGKTEWTTPGTHNIRVLTANGALSATDYTVISRAAGAINLTLPDPTTCKGRIYHIINNGGGDITTSYSFEVSTGNTQTIIPVAGMGIQAPNPNFGNKYM